MKNLKIKIIRIMLTMHKKNWLIILRFIIAGICEVVILFLLFTDPRKNMFSFFFLVFLLIIFLPIITPVLENINEELELKDKHGSLRNRNNHRENDSDSEVNSAEENKDLSN